MRAMRATAATAPAAIPAAVPGDRPLPSSEGGRGDSVAEGEALAAGEVVSVALSVVEVSTALVVV